MYDLAFGQKLTKLYKDFTSNSHHLNPQLKRYYLYLGATLAFSIGLQIFLSYLGVPWVVSMGIVLAIFIILPVVLRKRQMSRMGGYGSSGSGGFFGMNTNGGGIRYVCLVCNNKHKGGSCPRCGSKMQRADF